MDLHTDLPGSRNFLYAEVALATALRGETAAQVIQGMRKKIYPNGNDSTNKVFLLWLNGAFLLAMSCQAGTTSFANTD